MFTAFVVCVMSIDFWIETFVEACFVPLEESLKAQHFVSGCLKRDRVSEKGFLHTFNLEKAFSFRGLRSLTPTWVNAPGPTGGGGGGGGADSPRTPHFPTF